MNTPSLEQAFFGSLIAMDMLEGAGSKAADIHIGSHTVSPYLTKLALRGAQYTGLSSGLVFAINRYVGLETSTSLSLLSYSLDKYLASDGNLEAFNRQRMKNILEITGVGTLTGTLMFGLLGPQAATNITATSIIANGADRITREGMHLAASTALSQKIHPIAAEFLATGLYTTTGRLGLHNLSQMAEKFISGGDNVGSQELIVPNTPAALSAPQILKP